MQLLMRVVSLPINLHWNVEPGSLEVKAKLTAVPITLALGGLVMVVSGGVVSVPPSEVGKVTLSKTALCPVPVLPAVTRMVVAPSGRRNV